MNVGKHTAPGEQNPEPSHTPQRTCVGCREVGEPAGWERFVYVEGHGLIHDVRRKAPGRGVWVHADPHCLQKALERGGFQRSLKRRVELPQLSELLAQLREGARRRLNEALQIALRARATTPGQTFVKEAMRNDTIVVLILASDAGESTRTKFTTNAQRKGIDVIELWTGDELGQMAKGQAYVSVIGVEAGPHAERIVKHWKSLEALSATSKT
ncbi:DUF448 domain-containing protein [Lujinxingia vulgaris]|uniref:DUF448 domain-containing protein n=1 Tax=Lujinxingia vulgaris TaxID=2600176 RepID=A0A5C6XNQ7_9DELT|nr:DUF448 domain-containing protein [Lujinxingia vulgaris]